MFLKFYKNLSKTVGGDTFQNMSIFAHNNQNGSLAAATIEKKIVLFLMFSKAFNTFTMEYLAYVKNIENGLLVPLKGKLGAIQ